MRDCPDCLSLWAPRLPELPGTPMLVGAIPHPECVAHGQRVGVRSLDVSGWVSYLRRGFVKATFALTPTCPGAPWVGVVLADPPRGLPAAPVISGMGVHTRHDAAIAIATAEAVERYGVLLSHSRAAGGPAARPASSRTPLPGTAVASTRRTAVRRALAESLERAAIERLCADGSAANAEPWPTGGAARSITRALAESKLAGEVFLAAVLPGVCLCVVALVTPRGSLVALGTAASGSPRAARRRAMFEAYGLWAASGESLRSPVTDADEQLLASLRAPRRSQHLPGGAHLPELLDSRPATVTTDIGTRLSDECGLHAAQVALA